MVKVQTNKLSIYLIKKEYSSPEMIFKSHKKLTHESIEGVGDFYYGDSHITMPKWLKKFFGESFNNSLENNRYKIFTASSKATFLISVENRIFVITFGYGRTVMNPGVWEERFGLKIACNVIDSENLRSIDKKNMSVTPKLSKEQVTKDGTIADFGIDIEQDLIQGISGKTKIETFGQTVTGKDALSISVPIDISNIKDLLKVCYKKYQGDLYKKDFGWIDQISEIKDPNLISDLNDKLIEKIKNEDFEKTWMAIPEIVEWENISEFKFNKNSFGDDIDLPTYLSFLSDKSNLSLSMLKRHNIDCISAADNENINSWKVYNCLYCEIDEKGKIHILSNGLWYQIENDFVKKVSNSFDLLIKYSTKINLPECNQKEHEDKYNERAAKEHPNTCNMDGEMIYHGGANQKIEFCDLFTKDKKLIHVKHYGASSVLSHLFSQGLVSGELFLSDLEFREKLNDRLPIEYKLKDVAIKPNASEYEVVFAIISKSEKDLDIPFFSKVNIRNAKSKLEAFGYKVSLVKIETEIGGK